MFPETGTVYDYYFDVGSDYVVIRFNYLTRLWLYILTYVHGLDDCLSKSHGQLTCPTALSRFKPCRSMPFIMHYHIVFLLLPLRLSPTTSNDPSFYIQTTSHSHSYIEMPKLCQTLLPLFKSILCSSESCHTSTYNDSLTILKPASVQCAYRMSSLSYPYHTPFINFSLHY